MIVQLQDERSTSNETWEVDLSELPNYRDGECFGCVDFKGGFYFIYSVVAAAFTMGEPLKLEISEKGYGGFEPTEEILNQATVWIDLATNSQVDLSVMPPSKDT